MLVCQYLTDTEKSESVKTINIPNYLREENIQEISSSKAVKEDTHYSRCFSPVIRSSMKLHTPCGARPLIRHNTGQLSCDNNNASHNAT